MLLNEFIIENKNILKNYIANGIALLPNHEKENPYFFHLLVFMEKIINRFSKII